MSSQLRMSNPFEFQTAVKTCDLNARHLGDAHDYLKKPFPFTDEFLIDLTSDQSSYLDQLVYRYTKLQDAIGSKIFPILIEFLEPKEDTLTFIDQLNHLEKTGLLDSTRTWKDMRDSINMLQDTPNLRAKNLNASFAHIERLLNYWRELRAQAIHMANQYYDLPVNVMELNTDI